MARNTGGPGRILLICDFEPGLLRSVLAPYEFMKDTQVILVRRRVGHAIVPSNIHTITIPMSIVGTPGKGHASRTARLLLNTASYILVGSVVSAFAALRYRCNLIHTRFLFPEAIVGMIASILSGTKLLMTADGSDVNLYLRGGKLTPILLLLAKRGKFISVSKPIHDRLSSLGVPSYYLPNSVDGSKFRFVPLDEKEKLVIFVGTLVEIKRPQLLVEAIGKIREFVVDQGIKVRIIGEGPLLQSLDSQIQRLGLQESVSLEGYIPRERVQDYMKEAYVYVTCSTMEGLSFALLEAMASGCIVVASNIPSNTALIKDGETGLVLRGDDPVMLADKIKEVFLDRDQSVRLAGNARGLFDSEYDTRIVAHVLAGLYHQAAEPTKS